MLVASILGQICNAGFVSVRIMYVIKYVTSISIKFVYFKKNNNNNNRKIYNFTMSELV